MTKAVRRIADVVVVSGLLEGIRDRASTANVDHQEHTRRRGAFLAARGLDDDLDGHHAYWIDCMERGEMLVIFVMVWGAYRLVAHEVPTGEPFPRPTNSPLVGRLPEVRLTLPTGEVEVADLTDSGAPTSLARVTAGTYRVSVEADRVQIGRHEFLERVTDYPAGEGPDWTVWLQRIEDEVRAPEGRRA